MKSKRFNTQINTLLLVLFTHLLHAQTDITDIVVQLGQMEVFKECAKFKTEIEQQTKELNARNLTDKQRSDLRTAYTNVQEKHEFFFSTIKQSLLDNNKFQAVLKNPADASRNYMTLYQEIADEYNQSYIPVYKKLNEGSKGEIEDLVKFGISAFGTIISKIREKKQQKNDNFNALLPVVNDYLYKKYRLKTWSELDGQGSYSTPTQPDKNNNNVQVFIPEPTVNNLSGSIEFIETTNSSQSAISFEQVRGKGIDRIDDDSPSTTINDSYWATTTAYTNGTKFKINIQNTAFTYFIVLNPDGIKQLYPKIQMNSQGKSLEEETNKIGNMVLPAKGFFVITPDNTEKNSEDFCIIASRSELYPEETIEKLNAASGTLSERITQVFGKQRLLTNKSSITQSNGKIVFNATDGTADVLPLVFKILK